VSKKFYAFLFVYLCIGTFVFANILNLQFWPFSYFNPPETVQPLHFSLNYPIESSFIWLNKTTIVHVNVTLKPSAPLVERVAVNMTAEGSVLSTYAPIINNVLVYFIGAIPYSLEGNVPIIGSQLGVIILGHGTQTPTILSGTHQTITWNSQGDYAPVIAILFHNLTSRTETYPNLAVHVNSADVARSERYNRVNEAMSVALVLFGFVEGYGILRKIDEEIDE
jgi:hypothetical protein